MRTVFLFRPRPAETATPVKTLQPNVKTIKTLPLKVDGFPKIFEVRGEVIMHKECSASLMKSRKRSERSFLPTLVMAAAGSLRPAGLALTAKRNLNFYAYGYGEVSEMPADTQSGLLDYLKSKGFR